MKESTPAALSAIGATVLLAVGVCSFTVADNAAEVNRLLTKGTYRFDTSKPFKDLSAQEKRERAYLGIINSISDRVGDIDYDMRKKNLVGAVVDSPLLSFFGFVGSAFLVASALADWSLKRSKEREANLK